MTADNLILAHKARTQGLFGLLPEKQVRLLRQHYADRVPSAWVELIGDKLNARPSDTVLAQAVDLWVAYRLSDDEVITAILPHLSEQPGFAGMDTESQIEQWRSLYRPVLQHHRHTLRSPRYESSLPRKGMGKDMLRTILATHFGNPLIAAMEKAKRLTLIQSSKDLPEDIRTRYSTQLDQVAAATMPDGTVIMVADRINPDQAAGIFLHETGEHASMAKMVGHANYGRLVQHFQRLLRSGDSYASWAAQRVPLSTPAAHIASEQLAYLIEKVSNDKLAAPGGKDGYALGQECLSHLRSWLFRSPLAAWLDDIGAEHDLNMTPQDIAAMARQAVDSQVAQALDVSMEADEVRGWLEQLSPSLLDTLYHASNGERAQLLTGQSAEATAGYLYALQATRASDLAITLDHYTPMLAEMAAGMHGDHMTVIAGELLLEGQRLASEFRVQESIERGGIAMLQSPGSQSASVLQVVTRQPASDTIAVHHYRSGGGCFHAERLPIDQLGMTLTGRSVAVPDSEFARLLDAHKAPTNAEMTAALSEALRELAAGANQRLFPLDASGLAYATSASIMALNDRGLLDDQPREATKLIMSNPVVNQPGSDMVDFDDLAEAIGHQRACEILLREEAALYASQSWQDINADGSVNGIAELLDTEPERVHTLQLPAAIVFTRQPYIAWFGDAGFDGAIYGHANSELNVSTYQVFSPLQATPAPDLSRFPAAEFGNAYSLSVEEAMGRAQVLAVDVAEAYISGQFDKAEQLDQQLEALYQRIEDGQSEREEDGLTSLEEAADSELPPGARSRFESFFTRTRKNRSEDTTEAEQSLDNAIAETYASLFIYSNAFGITDPQEKAHAMRSAMADLGQHFGGELASNVTDEQIIDAAREVYESVEALRQRPHVRRVGGKDAARYARGFMDVGGASGRLIEAFDAYQKADATDDADLVFAASTDLEIARETLAETLNDIDTMGAEAVSTAGEPIYFSKSAKQRGAWQVTYCDEHGTPISDEPFAFRESAIESFLGQIDPRTLQCHTRNNRRLNLGTVGQHELPAFKAWFAKSVVSASDKPVPVYFGTNGTEAEFDFTGNLPRFTASDLPAKPFASVTEHYLSIQQPFKMTLNDLESLVTVADRNNGVLATDYIPEVARIAEKQGYDGLVIADLYVSGPCYVPFSADQIKPVAQPVSSITPPRVYPAPVAVKPQAEPVQQTFDQLFEGMPAADAKLQAKDNFAVRYVHHEVARVRTAFDKVNTPEEVAHLTSYIRKHGQETFLVVVTDDAGAVLNLFRYSKGKRGEAPVDPGEVAQAIAATPGATKAWTAHNHPSGSREASRGDLGVDMAIRKSLDGTDITLMGGVILSGGVNATFYSQTADHNREERIISIPGGSRNKTVALTERIIRKRGKFTDQLALTSPREMKALFPQIESPNALLLLNNQHHFLGTLTLTTDEMKTIREGGIGTRILAALDSTNASATIIKTDDIDAARNLARFLNNGNHGRVLDWMNNDLVSHAEVDGRLLNTTGEFFSLVEDPTPRFSFAGEGSQTACIQSLQQARAMQDADSSFEEIRLATGWFVGDDGQWRYEIDDSKAQLKYPELNLDEALDRVITDTAAIPVRVADLLNHPALFAAYPELGEIPVQVTRDGDPSSGNLVTAKSGALFIELGKDLIPHQIMRVLIHELQHAVQHREGFAQGGTASQFQTIDLSVERLAELDSAISALFQDQPEWANLQRQANRDMARIRERYGVTTDRGIALNWDNVEASDRDAYFALLDQLNEHDAFFTYSELHDERTRIDKHRELLTPKEQYQRLAGEIEARNVEHRLTLDVAARASISPESTRDVRRELAIVSWPTASAVPLAASTPRKQASMPISEAPASTTVETQTERDARILRTLDHLSPVEVATSSPAFKSWFGASKLVDGEGNPRVVYHGSSSDFTAFDHNKSGSETDSGIFGKGFYFTADPKIAEFYARRAFIKKESGPAIYPVYIQSKNPLVVKQAGREFGENGSYERINHLIAAFKVDNKAFDPDPRAYPILKNERLADDFIAGDEAIISSDLTEMLEAFEYDSVIYEFDDGDLEIAVFRQEQIKSAIGNNGDFDPANPDIRFSVAPELAPASEPDPFASWFGASKAVDETGKPLKMYHGTNADITEFSKDSIRNRFSYSFGFHFSSATWDANSYAIEGHQGFNESILPGGNVMPVYLKAENPLVIYTEQPSASMEADLNKGQIIEQILASRRTDKPYDSVMIVKRSNSGDSSWDHSNIIVFDPTQIKSAIGNNGNFNPDSPDIRFSQAPTVPVEQTPAFQSWFEGSALVDEEGKPLVLYHGTRPGNDITSFNLPVDGTDGIYFTPDPEYAEGFTNGFDADSAEAGATYPVYLSIKNPLVVEVEDGSPEFEKFVYRGYDIAELVAQGYDGAILKVNGFGLDQVIAFRPDQIKSAIGNNGNFDPSNPDIRFSVAPELSPAPEHNAFASWFVGSKVVDAQGSPLVMVHASPIPHIEKFEMSANDGAAWFSPIHDTSEADIVASEGSVLIENPDTDLYPDVASGSTFYPVYLSIKNPAPADGSLAADFYSGKIKGGDLANMGFDGIIWPDGVAVVFSSDQIKSAIGNNSKFDPSNPDNRFSVAPERAPAPEPDPFASWFGNSKAIDESGKPLVLYHGSIVRESERAPGMGDIEAFDRLFTTQFRKHSVDTVGSWFSTNPGAGGAQMYSGTHEGAVIYPVHLAIENPHETTFRQLQRRARLLASGEDDGRMLGEVEVNAYRTWLVAMGCDGIKIVHDHGGESTEFQHQDAWIALEPEQIKSAIGNVGSFGQRQPTADEAGRLNMSPAEATERQQKGDIRFSLNDIPKPWYRSALAATVGRVGNISDKNGMISPQQAKAWLASQQQRGAFKKEEADWVGINEWLDLQGPKITAGAIANYIEANGVEIEEVMRGARQYAVLDDQGVVTEFCDSLQQAMDRVVALKEETGNHYFWDQGSFLASGPEGTKYSEYAFGDGTNYRELLLKLPVHNVEPKYLTELPPTHEIVVDHSQADGRIYMVCEVASSAAIPFNGRHSTQEAAIAFALSTLNLELDDQAENESALSRYKSDHFEELNILAHVRMQDRLNADGQPVLFIEEIQSDWAKAVRNQRFTDDPESTRGFSVSATAFDDEPYWTVLDGNGNHFYHLPQYRASTPELAIAVSVKARAELDNASGVPAAPFVTNTKSWVALTVKRIMSYAAKEGYAEVAFINGEQASDRFQLSKKVSNITWNGRSNESDKMVTIYPYGPGNPIEFIMTPDGTAQGQGGGPIGNQFQGKKIIDIIGKQLGERLLTEPYGDIRGNGLTVGGEGMKAFYDQIVPQVLRDQLRKVDGSSPTETLFNAGNPEAESDVVGQLSFKVTDTMRERTAEGLPLFSMAEDNTLFRQAITPMLDSFWDWRKGTKVVDQFGSPKVMFAVEAMRDDLEDSLFQSGVGAKRFVDFATAWDEAERRMDTSNPDQAIPYQITPAYLALTNPVPGISENSSTILAEDLATLIGEDAASQIVQAIGYNAEGMQATGTGTSASPGPLVVPVHALLENPTWVAHLKEAGYDGATYGAETPTGLRTEHRIFNHGQMLKGRAMPVITTENVGNGIRFSLSKSLSEGQGNATSQHQSPAQPGKAAFDSPALSVQPSSQKLNLNLRIDDIGGVRIKSHGNQGIRYLINEVQVIKGNLGEAVTLLEGRLQWLNKGHNPDQELITKTQQRLAGIRLDLQSAQRWSPPNKHTMLPWDSRISNGHLKALQGVVAVPPNEILTGKQAFWLAVATHGTPDKAIAKLEAVGIKGVDQGGDMVVWEKHTKALMPHIQLTEEGARFHLAYHGSPHQFDQFKLDKVGTGEGFQAFGRGLYFADQLSVAHHYYDMTTRQSCYYEDTLYDSPHDLIDDVVAKVLPQFPEYIEVMAGVEIAHTLEQPLRHVLNTMLFNGQHVDKVMENYPEFASALMHVREGFQWARADDNFHLMPNGGVRALNAIANHEDTSYRFGLHAIESTMHWHLRKGMTDEEIINALGSHIERIADVEDCEQCIHRIKTELEDDPQDEFLISQLSNAEWALRQAQDATKLIETFGPLSAIKPLSKGHLYMVDVAIEPEQYLLHDVPFTEQSALVRETLTSLLAEDSPLTILRRAYLADAIANNYEGYTLYAALSYDADADFSQDAEAEQEAIEHLVSKGVLGIKYRDGITRDKEAHHQYNYVVFNESLVTILGTSENRVSSPEDFDLVEDLDAAPARMGMR